MNITTQLVTPEMARAWLENNSGNRRLKKHLVERLKNDIELGNWQLTHQPVAIAGDGQLLDGQHRLTAIAETGRTVPVMVATGCPKETFTVIDSGAKRTTADTLYVRGIRNSHTLAAAIRCYLLYKNYPDFVWAGGYPEALSSSQVVQQYNSSRDLWDKSTTLGATSYSRFRSLTSSSLVCFFALLSEAGYSDPEIEAFAVDLSLGAMLAPGDPVFAIRAALNSGCVPNSSRKAQGALAGYIKAFNYRREGVTLKMFKWPKVPPMPAIVAPDA